MAHEAAGHRNVDMGTEELHFKLFTFNYVKLPPMTSGDYIEDSLIESFDSQKFTINWVPLLFRSPSLVFFFSTAVGDA